jgi:hypothetical protein
MKTIVSMFAFINPNNGSGPTLPSDAIAKGLLVVSIPSLAFFTAVSSGVPVLSISPVNFLKIS